MYQDVCQPHWLPEEPELFQVWSQRYHGSRWFLSSFVWLHTIPDVPIKVCLDILKHVYIYTYIRVRFLQEGFSHDSFRAFQGTIPTADCPDKSTLAVPEASQVVTKPWGPPGGEHDPVPCAGVQG